MLSKQRTLAPLTRLEPVIGPAKGRTRWLATSPASGGGKNALHHMPVATRTMTGQRMTMNSTGKMHTIIGTASLAGRL